MKSSLSAIEIKYVLDELQFLIDSKLDRLYQPEKTELLFQFHKTGYGRAMVKVFLSGLIFLTDFKKENPENTLGFCASARKILLNSRLREIKQIGSERVVELVFETKEKKYKFILELFSKGNAIITEEDNTIIYCLERQFWKGREIKPKEKYIYPERELNFMSITPEGLSDAVKKSEKENIVKMLAIDLGLGGVYAEELCVLAGVDKEKKSLTDKEVKSLFKAIETMRNKKAEPAIIKDNSGKLVDVIPFALKYYDSHISESKETFNKALDEVYTNRDIASLKEEKTNKRSKEIEKFTSTISLQEKQLQKLQESADDNQKKGELIYEKYALINDLLGQIKEARKTMGWKEIKDKLKGKKVIVNIEESTGRITIDV